MDTFLNDQPRQPHRREAMVRLYKVGVRCPHPCSSAMAAGSLLATGRAYVILNSLRHKKWSIRGERFSDSSDGECGLICLIMDGSFGWGYGATLVRVSILPFELVLEFSLTLLHVEATLPKLSVFFLSSPRSSLVSCSGFLLSCMLPLYFFNTRIWSSNLANFTS